MDKSILALGAGTFIATTALVTALVYTNPPLPKDYDENRPSFGAALLEMAGSYPLVPTRESSLPQPTRVMNEHGGGYTIKYQVERKPSIQDIGYRNWKLTSDMDAARARGEHQTFSKSIGAGSIAGLIVSLLAMIKASECELERRRRL